MVKKAHRLRNVLARRQGRDLKLERQRKSEKAAAKRKRAKEEAKVDGKDGLGLEHDSEEEEADLDIEEEQWVSEDDVGEEDDDEDNETPVQFDMSRLDDSDISSSSEEDAEHDTSTRLAAVNPTVPAIRSNGISIPMEEVHNQGSDEGDIPLSDLDSDAASEDADIVPHQRLTINNTTALTRALNSIRLPTSTLPFSSHQSITSDAPTDIPDANDDFSRELALFGQSLKAVKVARSRLLAEGIPFTRPSDYFAEMVKSDEHMGKIKSKLVEEASNKKAAAEARKLRDLKKFGKKVQVEKKQERDREKKKMLERVEGLKRKRKSEGNQTTGEDELFDVALEDAATTNRRDREARKAKFGGQRGKDGQPSAKRQKKDQKFGFGGKKRFAKSGDAISSGDMSGFSTKRMKAGGGKASKGKQQRPGKSRRAKMK